MGSLDEYLQRFSGMPPEVRAQLARDGAEATNGMPWVPNPGPQTDAYFSEADVLLFGGEPGGGKSSLVLGLAFTQHRRSVVMRRQYTDLGNMIEEALQLNAGRQGFNGSPPPRLRRPDDRVIDFFAAARVGDEQHRQGNPFDFLGIDEATQLAQSQVRFLLGWLRSTFPGQRKRAVLATNPPLSAEGYWVTEWFAPWVDDRYPNPARPGELRWAIVGDDDKLVWVDGPQPVQYNGRVVEPMSYTFIPSSLDDNPFLAGTGYKKQLDNLPAEVREVLMGGFRTTLRDQANQIIPTEWIRLAQSRWTSKAPVGIPMCAIGVDCSGGGRDPMVMAPRHDGWYAVMVTVPAADLPVASLGKTAAGHVVANRRDRALITVDMGGGYGGALFERLVENDIEVFAYKGAEASARRTKDGKLRFTNTRTAAYWGFREALDPDQPGGSPIALPPDPEVTADLSAPTYEITPNGIKAESKEDVCARLGRSTNKGDAVVMSWYDGPKESTHALEWAQGRQARSLRGRQPQVVMGRQPLTGRR